MNGLFQGHFMDLGEANLMGPSTSIMSQIPQNKWRAKLYQLNHEGCWDDFGTGLFQIARQPVSVMKDQDDEYTMLLVSEEDEISELLNIKIRQQTEFSRQRGIQIYLTLKYF